MTSIEAAGKPRPGVARYQLVAVLAGVVFVLSAMLRQYREITIPLTAVLAGLALFLYFRGRRRA
jgi:hypothetical protein